MLNVGICQCVSMSDYQLLAIEASALRINIVRELKFVYEVSNL